MLTGIDYRITVHPEKITVYNLRDRAVLRFTKRYGKWTTFDRLLQFKSVLKLVEYLETVSVSELEELDY